MPEYDEMIGVDNDKLIDYIRIALQIAGHPSDRETIERILAYEMDYLQHLGLVGGDEDVLPNIWTEPK